MLLRNGKIIVNTTQIGIYRKMNETSYNLNRREFPNILSHTTYLENCFILRGKQTLENLHSLKTTFKKNDEQYLQMLMGFARIYQCNSKN
jgi:hypothetical protein